MKIYNLLKVFVVLFCIQQAMVADYLTDFIDNNLFDQEEVEVDYVVDQELYKAIARSDKAAVASLLDHGADANSEGTYGSTNLAFAVMKNNIEIAELLLLKGADVNCSGRPGSSLPLTHAIINQNMEMVKLLVNKYKADLANDTDYPGGALHFAESMLPLINGNRHPIVAFLVEATKSQENH